MPFLFVLYLQLRFSGFEIVNIDNDMQILSNTSGFV